MRKRIRMNAARPAAVRPAEELRVLNKEYKNMLRTVKREYYEKLNKVNSTQDLWRLLKKAKTASRIVQGIQAGQRQSLNR